MDPFRLTPPEPDLLRFGPKCCQECFHHHWLRDFVQRKSVGVGECEFCGENDVPLIHVGILYPQFINLLSMYEPVNPDNTNYGDENAWRAGERLDFLIQNEWYIFSEQLDCDGTTMDLLQAIIDAKHTDQEWNAFSHDSSESRFDRDELYTHRRMFWDWSIHDEWAEYLWQRRTATAEPGRVMSKAELERVGGSTISSGQILYRARKGYEIDPSGERQPYRGTNIGAPPPGKRSAGRANVEGQAVLYCADQFETAVAETRPARGLAVSVAELRITRDLRIIDLMKPPPPVNPFILEIPDDERDVRNVLLEEVELRRLLRDICFELSIPLSREDNPGEYKQTQAFSDMARYHGFDGIRYTSALQPNGTNVVLFDVDDAEVLHSKLVHIKEVNISYE